MISHKYISKFIVLKLVVNRSLTNGQGRKYHVVFMRCYDNIVDYYGKDLYRARPIIKLL